MTVVEGLDYGKLDPSIKREWLKALRSGEYTQGRGTLLYEIPSDLDDRDDPGEYYCCLGVLCDATQGGFWYATWVDGKYMPTKRIWRYGSGEGDRYRNESVLGDALLKRIGMTDKAQGVLTHMNDGGRSFADIADWIEVNL